MAKRLDLTAEEKKARRAAQKREIYIKSQLKAVEKRTDRDLELKKDFQLPNSVSSIYSVPKSHFGVGV